VKIEFLWKWTESQVKNCPALYKAEGGYVVQGWNIDDETRAQLRQLADNESAVFVPADVIDRIKELG